MYARFSEATGVRLYKNQTFHFEPLAATVVERVSVGRREEPLTVRAIDFNVLHFKTGHAAFARVPPRLQRRLDAITALRSVSRARWELVRLHLARNRTAPDYWVQQARVHGMQYVIKSVVKVGDQTYELNK